jgi:membrane protein implicated in regulation of membrane protease activity
MGCKGIHCPGCGDGGGAGIGAVVILLVLVVIIAAKAKAISHAAAEVAHAAAEVAHVLVLVAIAGASVTAAAGAVIIALAVRRKLRQIERDTGRTQDAVTGRMVRELHGHRAELPAKVYIHPPRERDRVSR